MAYLGNSARARVDAMPIGNAALSTSNELCYAIVYLAVQFSQGDNHRMNDVIGAIESAKAELYRKYINPASVQKEFETGS